MSATHDLVGAIAECLASRGRSASRAVVRAAIGPAPDRDAVVRGLATIGVFAQWIDGAAATGDMLPVVVLDAQGEAQIATALDAIDARDAVIAFAASTGSDHRADDLVAGHRDHWFWPVLWEYRRYYFEAAAQSTVINVLSLAGIVFTMTVYDRILPNQAFVTLWSLLAGVVFAIVCEFAARSLRAHVLDVAGRKIDLVLGDSVFARALAIRLEHRAQSSGAFANILKEFEAVRGFVTSATLVAIADLPFALLFLGICAMVGGWLVAVPLLAFVVVAVLSLAVQVPMARLANESLREAAVRHGTVIESLEGLETLKALGAEERMRRRHETSSAIVADRAMRSQAWSNLVVNVTVMVQQAASALLLAWGVYLASVGQATAGVLVACVQLSSRALAPLVTLSSLAIRFQQVRSALRSLDAIMALPVERDAERMLISGSDWKGAVELRDVTFRYDRDGAPAIDGVSLRIAPGERVAILGRIGSGKSTLLRLLAGLYRPRDGQVLLDGVEMTAIEPAEVRATVLLVGQDARLFHGSLRDNISIAAPIADDRRMIGVAEATGVAAIAAGHSLGFDRSVGERGDNLSGGQRQAVAMARALMADPRLLLLDEPTSAMDQQSEADLLRAVAALAEQGTGFVIVTHKQTVLPHVDRVIVMDAGRILADGPRDGVIQALSEGRVRSVA